jgi:hypothetical protein
MQFLKTGNLESAHPNRAKTAMQGGFPRRFTRDLTVIYCSAAIGPFGKLRAEQIHKLYQQDI